MTQILIHSLYIQAKLEYNKERAIFSMKRTTKKSFYFL